MLVSRLGFLLHPVLQGLHRDLTALQYKFLNKFFVVRKNFLEFIIGGESAWKNIQEKLRRANSTNYKHTRADADFVSESSMFP